MLWWDRIERSIAGLLGATAMVIALIQVIGRYLTPEHAMGSAEELIVYLMIWAIMITSSQLVRTDGHVRPDLVLRALPPGTQRWVEVFNCLVALAFTIGMVWYGSDIVNTALLLDERSSTGLEFPMWIYYAALPAGGLLMAVRYAIRLYRFAFRYDPASMAVGHAIGRETPINMRAPIQD